MGRPRKRRGNRRHARLRERLPSPRAIGAALLRLLARHRRSLVAAAVVAAVAGSAVGARAWLTTSPRFAIDRVELRGARLTPPDALAARLAVEHRPNLFLFDTAAAVARLEASPWIRRAAIDRDLPDGLVVEIEEHEPAALVVAGDLYLADDAGVLFKRATTAEAVELGLVAVTGLSRETIASDPEASAQILRRAVDLARRWQRPGRPALGEINIDPIRGFTLITTERAIAVRLGPGDDDRVEARLALFDRAWAALDASERERVAMVHLDQSAAPRRATVAFETEIETAQWAN